jgi:hypothetical protein
MSLERYVCQNLTIRIGDGDDENHLVAQLIEVLFYKPEGRRVETRSGHWDFSLI